MARRGESLWATQIFDNDSGPAITIFQVDLIDSDFRVVWWLLCAVWSLLEEVGRVLD